MSGDQLQRVEDDLAVLRAAMGGDLPFDRSHAALQMLAGAFGLPLLLLPWLGLDAYLLHGLLVFDGLFMVVWLWQFRWARSNRFRRPAVWRTARIEASSALLIGGLLLVFFSWLFFLSSQHPDWKDGYARLLPATVLFLLGMVGVTWVLLDHERWPNLTWFAGLLAMGVLVPLCELPRHSWMLMGACIIVGGLGSGLLELWQLSRTKVAHAD